MANVLGPTKHDDYAVYAVHHRPDKSEKLIRVSMVTSSEGAIRIRASIQRDHAEEGKAALLAELRCLAYPQEGVD